MIGVVISLYLFNGGAQASDTLHVLMGVSVLRIIMYNGTHMYLPNKRSSLLLHSRILLIECTSEYSESLYSRIHIRIRHPVFAIRIVFVTWCIRSSPTVQSATHLSHGRDLPLSCSFQHQFDVFAKHSDMLIARIYCTTLFINTSTAIYSTFVQLLLSKLRQSGVGEIAEASVTAAN